MPSFTIYVDGSDLFRNCPAMDNVKPKTSEYERGHIIGNFCFPLRLNVAIVLSIKEKPENGLFIEKCNLR